MVSLDRGFQVKGNRAKATVCVEEKRNNEYFSNNRENGYNDYEKQATIFRDQLAKSGIVEYCV